MSACWGVEQEAVVINISTDQGTFSKIQVFIDDRAPVRKYTLAMHVVRPSWEGRGHSGGDDETLWGGTMGHFDSPRSGARSEEHTIDR